MTTITREIVRQLTGEHRVQLAETLWLGGLG